MQVCPSSPIEKPRKSGGMTHVSVLLQVLVLHRLPRDPSSGPSSGLAGSSRRPSCPLDEKKEKEKERNKEERKRLSVKLMKLKMNGDFL